MAFDGIACTGHQGSCIMASVRTRGMHLRADRRGTTPIEYVLIAFLVAVAIISGATSFGTAVNSKITAAANSPGLQQ